MDGQVSLCVVVLLSVYEEGQDRGGKKSHKIHHRQTVGGKEILCLWAGGKVETLAKLSEPNANLKSD